MNLTDFEQTPIYKVFEAVRLQAAQLGTNIVSSEIVGLVPRRALEMTAEACLQIENFSPAQVLENRLEESAAPAAAPAGSASGSATGGRAGHPRCWRSPFSISSRDLHLRPEAVPFRHWRALSLKSRPRGRGPFNPARNRRRHTQKSYPRPRLSSKKHRKGLPRPLISTRLPTKPVVAALQAAARFQPPSREIRQDDNPEPLALKGRNRPRARKSLAGLPIYLSSSGNWNASRAPP